MTAKTASTSLNSNLLVHKEPSKHPVTQSLLSIVLVLSFAACTSTQKEDISAVPQAQPSAGSIQAVVKQGQSEGFETSKSLGSGTNIYALRVHSSDVLPLIKESYSRKDLEKLSQSLEKTLTIPLDDRGLAKAADRVAEGQADPTNYDAIWVRDSLWVYLGLKTNSRQTSDAKRLLLTLTDYFASPDQLQRFKSVIQNPALIDGEQGPMNVVHIRFDGRSPNFHDVQVGGKSQNWNHKQNDALGLYLDLFSRAVIAGEISGEELTTERADLIALFPKYFSAIRFHQMPDAGSWEEIERVNTSSIALVTSGLERLSELLARPNGSSSPFVKRLKEKVDRTQIAKLIDQGYAVVHKQLALGGESPSYPPADPRYRTSDAALLNIIYPAQLKRLKQQDYERVVQAVQPLIGEVGIKRYLKDSYQSGNFWFAEQLAEQARSDNSSKQKGQDEGQAAKTDDTSSAQDFLARGQQFIEGSEAQWFFDSWYSLAMGILHERYKEPAYKRDQTKFLNRALAQITGSTPPVLGADGQPVATNALPESYNTVVDTNTGTRVFAPSPITPLNWAKASLRLALTHKTLPN